MTWYQELGYKKNPLETDPFKANPELISYRKEAEELLYRIKAGSMVLIEGPEGSGKTLLLKQAINNFKGNNKVIYLDGKQTSKRIDIERVLNKRQSLTKRLLGRKPRNLILLMDDVQHLTRKNNERIKYYYDQNYLQSVAFTTTNKRIIPKSIKGRIGKRIIKLRKPTPEDAIKITINRLGYSNLLNKEIIRKIFALSKNNLKQHLNNCDKVLEYLISKDKHRITDIELERVISKQPEKQEETAILCFSCNEKLENIKESYRCPNCDTYCLKCDTIVKEKDIKCLECGIRFED